MEKYKKIFTEKFEKILTYRGRNIYDTLHSLEQFKERFSDVKEEEYYRIIRDGIDEMIDTYKDVSDRYIVISAKLNVGIQIEWRQDKYGGDKTNHGYSATTLDHTTQKKVTKGDKKIFVEHIKKYNLEDWFDTDNYNEMLEDTGCMTYKLEDCPEYTIKYINIESSVIESNFKIIKVG